MKVATFIAVTFTEWSDSFDVPVPVVSGGCNTAAISKIDPAKLRKCAPLMA